MTVPELLETIAALRTDVAADLRARKGVGGTAVLGGDNPFVMRATQLGWQTGDTATIYTLLKALEYAHAQVSIELFRDGASETANQMLAAQAASSR